jgi:hypothetical protein
MATWPLLFAIILAAVPSEIRQKHRLILNVGAILCLLSAVLITVLQVRPVLNKFNDGYRAAMLEGANTLRTNCKPGDTALVVNDIGVIAREGIGPCRLLDGGALATLSLRGLNLEQMIAKTQPTFVVQSIGTAPAEWTSRVPGLTSMKAIEYPDHSIAGAGQNKYLNIYSYERRANGN